jgi:anti-anti-sigma regulatory factor
LYDGDVLKITTIQKEPEAITVYLAGQLTGEYVAELESALRPEAAPNISLDMSSVTFVDRKAMEFLCGVKSRVLIENVPSYVLKWIEQEFRCGSSQKEHSDK